MQEINNAKVSTTWMVTAALTLDIGSAEAVKRVPPTMHSRGKSMNEGIDSLSNNHLLITYNGVQNLPLSSNPPEVTYLESNQIDVPSGFSLFLSTGS